MLSKLGKIEQPYYSTFREYNLKDYCVENKQKLLTPFDRFLKYDNVALDAISPFNSSNDDGNLPEKKCINIDLNLHDLSDSCSVSSESSRFRPTKNYNNISKDCHSKFSGYLDNKSSEGADLIRQGYKEIETKEKYMEIKMVSTNSCDYKMKDIKTSLIYYNEQLPSNSMLKMQISGNKGVLFDRLLLHFKQIDACRLIQRVFRGHCVRYIHSLRFDNSRENRKIAYWLNSSTNKTDFFSLEPIENIPKQMLYFYVDKQGFIYTFDIFSLLQYFIKNKGQLINPYNREKIDNSSFFRFYNLGIMAFRLYPTYLPKNRTEYTQFIYHIHNNRISSRNSIPSGNSTISNSVNANNNSQFQGLNETNNANANSVPERRNTHSSRIILSPNFMTQEELIIENLVQLRNNSLHSRIINAFIEIDNLGGYHTNHAWFTDLNKNALARFYNNYFEWWYNSPELLTSTKRSICIFNDPFLHLEYLDNYSQVSLDDYREACIYLIENMIYGGIDDEHRNLGAFQALTILSQVSLPAKIGLGYI